MSKQAEKEELSAFSKNFTGGPHGLGDPEDRTMRLLEDQVFINKLVKDHAHHTVCKDLIYSNYFWFNPTLQFIKVISCTVF